ncbi:MAG TPA: ATP-binding protein [Humisphaera sp.]|jgi:signal transduction histidine kinase|nr:ATP-binding protein [Humisphaera sp.]
MSRILTASQDLAPPRTARPDYARRVDELGEIIRQYSQITEKLQQSHDQLTQTVLSLRKELGDKNRQLETRNRLAALGEMAAGMAHEIRNPLGGIQLYASMLAKDVADRPQSLETVRKISGGVKRLESLVSQVLQFTRQIQVHRQPVDIAQLVSQAVEYASPKLAELGVACKVNGPPQLPASADPILLVQAVLNLLLNAAEAMQHGGNVSVVFDSSTDDARQFRIVIADTGPGIDPQILDRIFNPFFTTKDTGTGLGLSIVHRIVEAHEGTIAAVNLDGGGAKFEIRI